MMTVLTTDLRLKTEDTFPGSVHFCASALNMCHLDICAFPILSLQSITAAMTSDISCLTASTFDDQRKDCIVTSRRRVSTFLLVEYSELNASINDCTTSDCA